MDADLHIHTAPDPAIIANTVPIIASVMRRGRATTGAVPRRGGATDATLE
jgi:hypothetical protein